MLEKSLMLKLSAALLAGKIKRRYNPFNKSEAFYIGELFKKDIYVERWYGEELEYTSPSALGPNYHIYVNGDVMGIEARDGNEKFWNFMKIQYEKQNELKKNKLSPSRTSDKDELMKFLETIR